MVNSFIPAANVQNNGFLLITIVIQIIKNPVVYPIIRNPNENKPLLVFRAQNANKDVSLKLWDGVYHELQDEPEQAEVFKVMIEWMDKHL